MRIAFIALIVFMAGCSNTWQGVKDDSSKVWEDTKQAIHEATEE
ncbi:hypothetical protein GCM10007938_06300 [Vibrio zhanjiangensis]|uniref:Entericidin EcnAB n=1 Tax=Vibrio zhanjiangensis TaxID=1046128 RepID=A0ABQ6EUM1_9VIBR|nr:entericidin EcnAB [Vibrio zhanjiangensis]GLT16853.1 hypothetical protein GCM10007938_06300 [Vibrio zhanjiangensis]